MVYMGRVAEQQFIAQQQQQQHHSPSAGPGADDQSYMYHERDVWMWYRQLATLLNHPDPATRRWLAVADAADQLPASVEARSRAFHAAVASLQADAGVDSSVQFLSCGTGH